MNSDQVLIRLEKWLKEQTNLFIIQSTSSKNQDIIDMGELGRKDFELVLKKIDEYKRG